MLSFVSYINSAEEPVDTNNYKRAVFRAAPSRFSVEFLTPAKQGSAYIHGMRIRPMSLGDCYSISSKSSESEYDIWRRWEDCLWLQDTLESEYKRAAREKRQRLLQGKGVKSFNGMYKRDMASSWVSLPPGPDPNSVARDIHQHVPFLTKRGTLFRASLATVEQRQREFEGLIEALFRDDMPALIKEIHSSRIVTDFFGFWRRDHDLAECNGKAGNPCNSVTSSVFSTCFSSYATNSDKASIASSRSLHSTMKKPARTSKEKQRPRSAVTPGDCGHNSRRSSTESTDASTISVVSPRRCALSNSSDSSSSLYETNPGSPAISSTPAIADDAPLVFDHNPLRAPDTTCPLLVPLSDKQEELEKGLLEACKIAYLRRPKTSAGDRPSDRYCSIFTSPPNGPDFTRNSQPSPTEEIAPADPRLLESWQTTDSNATFVEDLGLTAEPSCRSSMASIATFVTTDSANATIPITPTTPRPSVAQPSVKPKPLIPMPVSLPDYEMWSECEEEGITPAILDKFPRPTSYISGDVDSRPETPMGNCNSDNVPEPEVNEPLPRDFVAELASTTSEAPSVSSATTVLFVSTTTTDFTLSSTSTSGSLSIKAAYSNSIIMLRVPRDIPFSDLRQRLYNKFVGQEGVPLSRSFIVASTPSKSLTAQYLPSVSCAANKVHMELINCQSNWEQLAASIDGSKLTLRILDGPP